MGYYSRHDWYTDTSVTGGTVYCRHCNRILLSGHSRRPEFGCAGNRATQFSVTGNDHKEDGTERDRDGRVRKKQEKTRAEKKRERELQRRMADVRRKLRGR